MDEARKKIFDGVPADPVQLTDASRFCFECRKDLACYNTCCSRIGIILSPYDILRMKRRLGLSSEDFLLRHTTATIHEGSGLPLVMLRMRDDEDRRCPFLVAEGCSLYTDRPAMCRYYPIGVAALKTGTTAQEAGDERFYFTIREDHCLGHREERGWSVGEWRRNQGVEEYDDFNGPWLEMLLLRSIPGTPEIDPRQQALFALACYNADRFRRFVLESSFLEKFEVPPALVTALRHSDLELVLFGLRYARYFLLLEETLQVRPGVVDAWMQKREG